MLHGSQAHARRVQRVDARYALLAQVRHRPQVELAGLVDDRREDPRVVGDRIGAGDQLEAVHALVGGPADVGTSPCSSQAGATSTPNAARYP